MTTNECAKVSVVASNKFNVMNCERCKYFKSCYQTYSDYVELDCKKGEKRLLIDGVFSCGYFKPKRRK